MKKLSEEVSLKGRSEEISMMDLRKHPGEILMCVELGKKYIIKRNGKKIAVLSELPKGGKV